MPGVRGSRGPTTDARRGRRQQRCRAGGGPTRLHARAEPGPEGHPRLGPRLRRGRRPARRRRVGRARGDALAGDPGGRQDRPLQLRSDGQFWADHTGLTLPIANEELFWGDAGIGMAIMGTSLAVAAIFGQGTPEQIGEWIPQCFGTAGRRQARRLLRLRARCRLRRLGDPHHRQVRRGQRRVGAERPEGLGDQRRHRQRPRGDRLGRPRARLARPRRFRDPAGDPRLRAGREG